MRQQIEANEYETLTATNIKYAKTLKTKEADRTFDCWNTFKRAKGSATENFT